MREPGQAVVVAPRQAQLGDALLGGKRGLGEGRERGPRPDVQPDPPAQDRRAPERLDEVDRRGRVLDPDAADLRRIGRVGRGGDAAHHRHLGSAHRHRGDQLAYRAGHAREERRVECV